LLYFDQLLSHALTGYGRDFIEVFNGLASSSASHPFAGPKAGGMAVLVSALIGALPSFRTGFASLQRLLQAL
jgi:hypothetical protein